MIEVDAEGLSLAFKSPSFCGISSGYSCFGDAWVAWARSGGPLFLVPAGSDDENTGAAGLTYELTFRGPVFSLP